MESVYLLSPTSNQTWWDRIRKKLIIIDEIIDLPDNSILICDDMQMVLKGNKELTNMILNKRHKNISIIQCEQYTQITDLAQKSNSDYFVLLGSFTLSDCQYFCENFLSSSNSKLLYEIIKYMNKNRYRFLWTDREENICLGFKKQVISVNMNGVDTFCVRDCLVR